MKKRALSILVFMLIIFNTNQLMANDEPKAGTDSTSKSGTSISDEIVLKTVYTRSKDIVPNTFKVKVGKKIKLIIDVKETGTGCMSTILIPGLYDRTENLIKGKLVLEFTPKKKGVYPITCAMDVKRGFVTVEENK